MARQMANEEEVLAMLSTLPGVSAEAVDLGTLSLVQQVARVASTDVLIGASPPTQKALNCKGLFPRTLALLGVLPHPLTCHKPLQHFATLPRRAFPGVAAPSV